MNDDLSAAPVGQGDWTVEAGDSMASIADLTGHFWQTIWDDAANKNLKEIRENPETLLPGDKVTVPPLREKKETRETDLIHTFKRRGVPILVSFTVAEQAPEGMVFAGKRYVLVVGKRRYEGKTDENGRLEHWVTPSAKHGTLSVDINTDGFPDTLSWTLKIGQVPPIDTMTGVLWRLKNLGYARADPTATEEDTATASIRKFQHDYGLPDTGEPDVATRDKLESVHGS